MVLKTVNYDNVLDNDNNVISTKLSVIYSIFGIVFYSKVYTRPIRNEHSLEVQKVKELIFANEIQVNAQIRELKIKDLNTSVPLEQILATASQLIDSKISANNQHLKYDIWELGLKLEGKLKLNTIVTVSQQKQANEQTKQDNQQNLATAIQQNEQILATAKIYTCANCAKTFDNCRKYAGHKTHCKTKI